MRPIQAIRRNRAAIDAAVRAGGDIVRWEGERGKFSKCPTCKGGGGKLTVGWDAKNNAYMFFCHRCQTTGDAIGLLHGYRHGSVDTTYLRGNRQGFAQLTNFFRNIIHIPPAAERRVVVEKRREWSRATLKWAELLSPEQVLVLAYAAPAAAAWEISDVVRAAERAAPMHLPDTLRRRANRWVAVWEEMEGKDSDRNRWHTLMSVIKRRGDDGRYVMSAGARFFIVAGFVAIGQQSRTLAAMAADAGVSVATARRWWNYWVIIGIFTGRLFVRKKAPSVGRQLELGLVESAPVAITQKRRVRRQRVHSRRWNLQIIMLPTVFREREYRRSARAATTHPPS